MTAETTPPADDQAALWNGSSGNAWVDAQALTDRMFAAIADAAVRPVQAGTRVLDVGCGTGATTVAAARRAGVPALGADISAPMLAAARARVQREDVPARFLLADVQTHPFEPDSFDLVISRFGVMFFADPVAAFANLRTAAAGLHVVAWRAPAENAFMTTATRAAAPLLPDLPKPDPGAPGQFAFADAERVDGILAAAGWSGIEIQPADLPCTMPEDQLVPYIARFGPVGRALQGTDDATRARVLAAVRPAFDPFVDGDEVHFDAACWLISAS